MYAVLIILVVTFGIGAAVFNDCEASSKNLLIIIVHSFLYEEQDDFLYKTRRKFNKRRKQQSLTLF